MNETRNRIAWRCARGGPGFTLVELLVVIGIIALLISILLPVLARARDHAKAIVCQSNEKQLMLAFLMYIADNKGRTPLFPPIPGSYPGSTPGERSLGYYTDNAGNLRFDVGAFWKYTTLNYRGDPNASSHETMPPPQLPYRLMNCPGDDFPRLGFSPTRNFSYSWNAELWNITGYGFGPNKSTGDQEAVSRINQIKEPSQKIVLCEEVAANDGWCVIDLPNAFGQWPADTPTFRHVGRGNWGFADGHVESFEPSELGFTTVHDVRTPSTAVNPPVIARYFHLQSNEP